MLLAAQQTAVGVPEFTTAVRTCPAQTSENTVCHPRAAEDPSAMPTPVDVRWSGRHFPQGNEPPTLRLEGPTRLAPRPRKTAFSTAQVELVPGQGSPESRIGIFFQAAANWQSTGNGAELADWRSQHGRREGGGYGLLTFGASSLRRAPSQEGVAASAFIALWGAARGSGVQFHAELTSLTDPKLRRESGT